jgi:TorA maturation chaperone TorD
LCASRAEALEPGALTGPWLALVASAHAQDAASIAAEYDALFGGVGAPEVALYGSYYLAGFLNEKPLARLRDDLATLGVEREATVAETEDHISFVCEIMRYLISDGPPLARQKVFFGTHLHPWVSDLCDAISGHAAANFYAALAHFTLSFTAIEAQAFDMIESRA